MPTMLTRAAAARRAHVNYGTINRWIDQGYLLSVEADGYTLVDQTHLDALIAERASNPTGRIARRAPGRKPRHDQEARRG